MSHRSVKTRSNQNPSGYPAPHPVPTLVAGQALVEYVIILALVIISLAGILALTGPAVGNVFEDQVLNLIGGEPEVRPTLSSEELWRQVTAVASYTPESPKIATNTPRPNTPVAYATEEPPEGEEPPGGENPPGGEEPPPGPSPTPVDLEYGYPFEDDASDPDRWETGFTKPVTMGTWNAEYWSYGSGGSNCRETNIHDKADGTGAWQTTHTALAFDWGDASPHQSVAANFCARYRTIMAFEASKYIWKLRKDDGIRIWVDGVLTADAWGWNYYNANEFTSEFTITEAGQKEVLIEFFDSGGAALLYVDLLIAPEDMDIGQCSWAISPVSYHSPPDAWNDSPNGNYAPGSRCNMRLRGTVDLTTAERAELIFWDRYSLSANTVARVEIRQAETETWNQHIIHQDAGSSGWFRQKLDLAPYLGQVIELRFVLDATAATSSADGWVIDDISINTPPPLKEYRIGFYDNMEGESHWIAGETWARTGPAHNGALAWTDSPAGDYLPNANSILELDGVIVLSDAGIVEPEIVFWHKHYVRSNDYLRVEVSLDREHWTELARFTEADRLRTWQQHVLSLRDYIGQDIYLRFRLTSNDSSQADGWWIDDFAIRERPNNQVAFGWCDNVENMGENWIANGTWGVVQQPDSHNSMTINAHSGGRFWSDSPRSNYVNNSSDALEMQPWLVLPADAVEPQLVFWQQWDINSGTTLAVEIMRQSTGTWEAPIWSMSYNSRPPGYNTVDSDFNRVLSWQRTALNLDSYRGDNIKVRFRRKAGSNNANGWWLDDICFESRNETTWTLPFINRMDSSASWYRGGTWAASAEEARSNGIAFSDSPGRDYTRDINDILELRGVIDLGGAVEPTLYYWDRHMLGSGDRLAVEICIWNDATKTCGNWFQVDAGMSNPVPEAWSRTGSTTSWNRRQGNLTAYAGQKIRLRFRLRSDGSNHGNGWWVDELSIVERYNREAVFPNTFSDNADVSNTWWVFDGDWQRGGGGGSDVTNIGSGAALGSEKWHAYFYADTNKNREIDPGELRGDAYVTEINSKASGTCAAERWGSNGRPCGVNLPSDDYFIIRWTRTITVTETTAYQLLVTSDDGLRIFVNDQLVYNFWQDRGENSPPDVADVVLTPGSHVFRIEYYEKEGGSVARVDFARYNSGMVYLDSPGGYVHGSNASMTLEGLINLAGLDRPYLRFDQKRSVGSGDVFYVEVSTDGGYTWRSVANWNNDQTDWTTSLVDLSSYKNQRINIRFRVDARVNSNTANGWFIDNIAIMDY